MTTQKKQAERQSAIIEGISRNMKPSEIASYFPVLLGAKLENISTE